MRSLALLLAVTLTGAVVADDKKGEKIDPAKLVGKWKMTKSGMGLPEGMAVTIEYTKTGELKVTMAVQKMEFKMDGKYTLTGAKLETVMNVAGGEDAKGTMEIVKLTDTTLHTKGNQGDVDEYERVKEEKKDEKKDK